MKRGLMVAAAFLGLAGCVGNESPPAATRAAPAPGATAPAAAGAAGTRFDGTYTGVLGAPSASGPSTSACYQSGTPQTLRVANGQLRGGIFFRAFNGPLGPDGSFNLTGADTRQNGQPGTIEGRITPAGLDGTFTFRAGIRTTCTYALNGMTRS